ncbi:bifunctional 2-C-methyl-D-erythritol 4-phosphate cytidylyltransferase/2-C-methyl-D-erythritol 2,4-cyclodiphosphate synthase [Magnetospira sp. QH-2]|uniref:bifunctional 2-C-methyl-D-erythritol 4-phosphate cytidylyltransferase/2-C-methyl-D-erythritol 2,4-cyclodiphosphate synthase n=1 Tax=Magnetospira sp. (strain QH-2) TaxID=1288970 RepID=UPI0003E81265|nr:bifunctional 2-C-methyl-D-erythritol 4-phosphate cytidylyltransferase/2-C-methyl-D-erythritol 2,4-cyclodiphosphate synthase [Magnetospira sp. QH-2]CCQ73807.1 IspD/ispF bifunctional enzyme [Includes: 2-C-methyl-D-erythritol 4-phosphate cytidylyltransferase (4-diphosphocytidyl-2C-methyl-D-erythritol synthase) (MEP cytidylyltransferase) (MCT); 2-C-methyl-D-erythritol 2, 4-cyclodiphosphate synthase (MECPS) (MECDP-synthase)] [Magnetospira sp. QH-2]
MSGCWALIVSAGRGRRFGGDLPKQYQALGGKPLLRRTLRAFLGHPRVDGLKVIIHPDDRELYDEAAKELDLPVPAHGGPTRQDSVRLGLESIREQNPDLVLIHDAARPFPSADLIDRVIDQLGVTPGVIPAVPVADTLKRGDESQRIIGTVERAGLWRAQTPQGFHFDAIMSAHLAAAGRDDLTDDAAVAELMGHSVALVMGSEDNFKVTTREDLDKAERLIAPSHGETRTGFGMDVHRFTEGDGVTLCGITVPHGATLAGHSDADVAMHALTDAILGAVGSGDIGSHFPPSEPQWKGAASEIFLRHAVKEAESRGARLIHLDLTIICERPKIGPHREAMRTRLGEILSLAPDRISVKATTTEKLGFTGRGEGIAAQAVATLRFDG